MNLEYEEVLKLLMTDLYESFARDIDNCFIINDNSFKKYVFQADDQINIYELYYDEIEEKIKFKKIVLWLNNNTLQSFYDGQKSIYFEKNVIQVTQNNLRETLQTSYNTVSYIHDDLKNNKTVAVGYNHPFFEDSKTIIGYYLIQEPIYVGFSQKKVVQYEQINEDDHYFIYNFHKLKNEFIPNHFYVNMKNVFGKSYNLEDLKQIDKLPEVNNYLIRIYNGEDLEIENMKKIVNIVLENAKIPEEEKVKIYWKDE